MSHPRYAQVNTTQSKASIQNTYDVGLRPGLPDGIGDGGVMLLHQLQVLVPRFLGIGLEGTAGHEVLLHLAVTPSGVHVVLRLVEGLQGAIGVGRNKTRDGVGNRARER